MTVPATLDEFMELGELSQIALNMLVSKVLSVHEMFACTQVSIALLPHTTTCFDDAFVPRVAQTLHVSLPQHFTSSAVDREQKKAFVRAWALSLGADVAIRASGLEITPRQAEILKAMS